MYCAFKKQRVQIYDVVNRNLKNSAILLHFNGRTHI
jgi:hypothetical protein